MAVLTVKNESGNAVDWWFMYKLPARVEPKQGPGTQGNEYLYYDPDERKPLRLSPYRLGTGDNTGNGQGALFHTLRQVFVNPGPSTGWIIYNDEYPEDMSPFEFSDDYWEYAPKVTSGTLTDADRTSLTEAMVAEGLIRAPHEGASQPEVTDTDLLTFQAARNRLIEDVAAIEEQLVATWEADNEKPAGVQRLSPWPPGVRPAIHSGRSRKKDRGKPADHGSNGHSKGVLAFDLASDTAFWLSHSTPRTIPSRPATDPATKPADSDVQFFYPGYDDQYAQTFVCIALESVETACRIAGIMAEQHEPQVFGCHLPAPREQMPQSWAGMCRLARGSVPPTYDESYRTGPKHREPVAGFPFKSKGGKGFLLFAKSGAWFDDFWIDLVGPNLSVAKDGKTVKGVDLRVETWRRLTRPDMLPGRHLDADTPDPISLWYKNAKRTFKTTHKGKDYYHEFFERYGHHVVDEVTNVDLERLTDPSGLLTGEEGEELEGYMWSYTRDHAKWAISEEDEDRGVHTFAELSDGTVLSQKEGTSSDWVCIADINRMTSQERRGGGAICFHEPLLWHCLNEIEMISGEIT